MSSLLRITRIPHILNVCRSIGATTAKKFKVNDINIATSSTAHKIRTYVVQSPQENIEILTDKAKAKINYLENEFVHIDSILRRGGFLKRKTIEDFHRKVMENASLMTPSQSLFLLRCCGLNATLEKKDTRNKLVSRIWSSFQEKDLSLDISHYNAVLQVFLENEHQFSPLGFLETLQTKNIEPNRITYSRLIARFCQEGDIEGANKILEFMKEKEISIGENVFNSLILGNSRANDMEGALNIMEVMRASQTPPSSSTYSVLLQAYAEHEDMDGVRSVLAKCKEEEVVVGAKALLDVVCVLANKGMEQQHITEILSSIETRAGYPILVTQTISHLLDNGHHEIAFQLYRTLSFNPDLNYLWGFFPKMVAAADLDLNTVVKYCDELRTKGWNILSYELAVDSYLHENKFESALSLLRIMKEKEIELKEHYFYPLFCDVAKQGDGEKIYELMEQMLKLNVSISVDLVSAFLIPSLSASTIDDLETVYMRLMNYQGDVDLSIFYNGIVEYLLKKHDLDLAAQFVNKFRRGLRWSMRPLLIDCYLQTLNADSVVCILRQMLPISVRLNRADVNDENFESGFTGIKLFLGHIIRSLQNRGHLDQLNVLLQGMEREGIFVPSSIVAEMTSLLGEEMTSEVESLLNALSSPSLLNQIHQGQNRNYGGARGAFLTRNGIFSKASRLSENEQTIRRNIEDAQGEEDPSLQIALLANQIKQKKVTEVQELLIDIKSKNINLSPQILLILSDMYVDLKDLDEAEIYFNQLGEENESFQIHGGKVIKYATLLVQKDRIADVVKCLLMNSPEDGEWPIEENNNDHDEYLQRIKVRDLLTAVLETKDLSSLKLVQETLISRKFATPASIMPSLVMYHLNNNDLEEAMSSFQTIAEEYRITPAKEALTTACIHAEDTQKIQQIMDISSKVHGDMNTLYDLVFAFIDLDKLKQAERVLQTSGLRTLQSRLNGRCELYLRNDKFSRLEGLVQVTKGLFNVDREKLYNYLLQGMIAKDDPDKALAVWTTMQEEGVDASSPFLSTLGRYLQSKGLEIPFVMPTTYKSAGTTTSVTRRTTVVKEDKVVDIHKELTLAFDSNNIDKVEEIWQRGKETNTVFSNELQSRYITKLLHQEDKLDEALEMIKELLVAGDRPSIATLRILLQKLSLKGDVATVQFLEKYFDENLQKKILYSFSFGISNVIGGMTEQYLNNFMEMLQPSSQSISKGVVLKIMDEQPQYIPLLQKCADAENKNGSQKILYSMWEFYYREGKTEEAEEIYSKYMVEANNFNVQACCSKYFAAKDTNGLEELLKVVDRKKEGREALKGYVLSIYLDILNKGGKHDEALTLLEDNLESLKLSHFRESSLNMMKKKFYDNKKTFPFDISKSHQKAESSSSSSSSSSDDEKSKRGN